MSRSEGTPPVPLVGQRLPRVEDLRFVSGRGAYTDDIRLEGQVYCAFVRSPHAHARLAEIDATRARAMPGVLAVLDAADYLADGLCPIDHQPNPLDAIDIARRALVAAAGERVIQLPHWPLARERVRYVGEPVAAVIARSADLARDAAEAVEVDYEPLAAVASPLDAAAGDAPQLHDEVPGNRCFSIGCGDEPATRAAIAKAPTVIRREFVNQRIANCQMEPRAATGDYDAATSRYTLISGSQGVVRQRQALARALNRPPDEVRVICPDVGGGFGPRTMLYPEQVVVVWAAARLGRPVKWTGDRSEAFISDFQARDSVARAALALDAEGRILGYEVELFGNIGAHTVSFVPMANAQRILTTVYHIPAAHVRVNGMLSNTVPTAPYRGAGRPEATHVLERLLDIAARRLGIDRIQLRTRNLVRRDMLPYRNAMGLVYDSGDFHGYQRRVLDAADWAGFAARREAARLRGKIAGIGCANYVESPVGAASEHVDVSVSGQGVVEVIVGTQSTGQGHETTFAQVIADQLGVPLDCVRIRYGDTDFVKAGGGTHSDRSMRLAGTLLARASDDIIGQGREAAAKLLEAATSDLAFESGRFLVAGTDRALGLFDVAAAIEAGAIDARRTLAAASDLRGRIPAFPAGAAVCELEVDAETGTVAITRYTTVDDVGQAVNPLIVHGQTHGGIAQGAGQALREGVALDCDSGQPLAGSFMDYGLTRADDLPCFNVSLAEDPTGGNPLRVKGGGEGGIVPATAAVINALCDALCEYGVEDMPMPATPLVIWRAMQGPAQRRTALPGTDSRVQER